MDITKYNFFHALTELPFIEEIWLYGSRARGDESDRSDIDIAIVAPAATQDNWQQVRDIIDNADTLLKIDCIRFDTLKDALFKKNIIKDKKVLFKRAVNMQEKINQKIMVLEEAVSRLIEAVEIPVDENPLSIDGTIQRFEFSFELFWKTLKIILKSRGVEVAYPKDALQAAYQGKIISDEKLFIKMLEDRNETSHTYDENLADKIYQNIKLKYAIRLKEDTETIKKQFYRVSEN